MAAPPEVTIGPFENVDGSKVIYPLPLRNVNLWVSWSEDPGDAFSASNIRYWRFDLNTGQIITQHGNPNFTTTLLKRVDNRFLFHVAMTGFEWGLRVEIPSGVYRGNATTTLDVLVNTFNPFVRDGNYVLPTDDPVETRNTSVQFTSQRNKNAYWQKEGFSLEGIVNGAFYSSRDAITGLRLPFTDSQGRKFAGRGGKIFHADIQLPDKSKGTVRVRIDKFSALSLTGGRPPDLADNLQLEYAGRGPTADYLTEPFNFDTTRTTRIAMNRGARGTNPIEHAENSQILLIDEVMDIRDTRWVVKPIDELQWRTDERNLYNKIRVLYGNGNEFVTTNPQSVFENGEREFTMRTPLAQHQTHWVRWIAQNLLDSFGEMQYVSTLQLKQSLQLRLGQTLLLRGLPQDDINDIVQIIGIEHRIASQSTLLTVRTVKRATTQSETAPAFATNTFTSGSTVMLSSGTTYNAQLVAFGNPTPTISATGQPSWMTIDSEGNISGTVPNVAGTSTVTFTATNGVTPNATFTLTFSIVIANRWNSGAWNTFRWDT